MASRCNGSPVWAHDGKRLAFHSNARDGVSYDIYIVDVDSTAPPPRDRRQAGHVVSARLVAGRYEAAAVAIRFHQRELPVRRGREQRHGHAARRRRADNKKSSGSRKSERRKVDRKDDGKVGIRAAKFAPDGRGVYIVSDEAGEFARLLLLRPGHRRATRRFRRTARNGTSMRSM